VASLIDRADQVASTVFSIPRQLGGNDRGTKQRHILTGQDRPIFILGQAASVRDVEEVSHYEAPKAFGDLSAATCDSSARPLPNPGPF
jgi:hypothetical protein